MNMPADKTRHKTNRKKKKRKTEDKMDGCCEQRLESGGIGSKDGG